LDEVVRQLGRERRWAVRRGEGEPRAFFRSTWSVAGDNPVVKIFYSELAPFWPLLSPVEDYAEEAAELLRVLEPRAPRARRALELGSGGGHVAHFLKRRFSMTLSDLSPEMLAESARLNPDCEHVVGDMRTLELGACFDLVFVHDAVDYMTTERDLEAVIATAHRHLEPGGLAVFVPDHVRERYEAGSESGGSDAADGRGIRYLEWTTELAPGATAGTTHYCFLVREADGSMRCLHERHDVGVFPEATWVRLFERVGFAVEVVEERTDDERTPRLIFIGRKSGGTRV
jgi:SAM-dependent methyltransferase